jgi:hypothetical protein
MEISSYTKQLTEVSTYITMSMQKEREGERLGRWECV